MKAKDRVWGLWALCLACGSGASEAPRAAQSASSEQREAAPTEGPAQEAARAAPQEEGPSEEPSPEPNEPGEPPAPSFGSDPIGRWAAHLNGQPLWTNGIFPTLDLPASATDEEVLRAMFSLVSFDEGRVTEFDVLAARTVPIGGLHYRAVHVRTNLDNKVVFMQHNPHGWWSRVYPARFVAP